MNGFVLDLETATKENANFRKVIYTAKNCQLVLMSLKPQEEIGMEVHELDQFLRVDAGMGKVILNGVEHEFGNGFAVIVPAGVNHNIINTSATEDLKLYTLYCPPHHEDGVSFLTKAEAEASSEHFDGKTTE
jgi:mannose-6-phosphate isomerase-like protein (cupin superfamily)